MDRLKAGNKDSALKQLVSHAQAKYSNIFNVLGADLATAAAQLGVVTHVTAGDSSAELIVTRVVGGEQRVFMVYLIRGEDGIWRIDSM